MTAEYVHAMNNVVSNESSNYIHKYLSLSEERREVVNAVIDAMCKLEGKEKTNAL